MLSYLWEMEANRNFILHYYSEMESKIEKLRTKIKEEINGN